MVTSTSGPRFGQLVADVHQPANRLVIRLRGELDVSTAPGAFDVAVAALQASVDRRVDLDLSGVTFCDSTGVRTLLDLQQHASRRGCELCLIDASARVRRIFEILGFADLLKDGSQSIGA
jgi:anti-sigma B factor antagonist